MYQNKKYLKHDQQFIFRFIQEHPFATLVLSGDRLTATHIPVLSRGNEDEFVLYGHIANHNPMVDTLREGKEILIIFHGAHGYISSSWYKEKDISTWDYSAVHINATLQIQSKADLHDCLINLVARFEKEQEHPLFFHDIPQKMIDEHFPYITGFWCKPFKVEGIAKLHQGFEADDIKSITAHLEKKDNLSGGELSRLIKKEHGTDN